MLNFENCNPTVVRDSERKISGLKSTVRVYRVVEMLLIAFMLYAMLVMNFSMFYIFVLCIITVEIFCSSMEKSIKMSEEIIENYLRFLRKMSLHFARNSWINKPDYEKLSMEDYMEKSE